MSVEVNNTTEGALVRQTTEYKKFKTLEGNRELDKQHIKHLGEAISARPDLVEATPILVNERFEVIDGQHRLEVLKQLKRPVPYIQIPGLGLGDVQTLNSTSKLWAPIDYAKSYAQQGNSNYQTYLTFREQFPFGHKVILLFSMGSPKSHRVDRAFRSGHFVIKDVEQTDTWLNYLDDVRSIVPHLAHRPTFAAAFLRILQSPNYDHARMLHKLEMAKSTLQLRDQQAEYLRDLENVFNFNSKTEPVRLF